MLLLAYSRIAATNCNQQNIMKKNCNLYEYFLNTLIPDKVYVQCLAPVSIKSFSSWSLCLDNSGLTYSHDIKVLVEMCCLDTQTPLFCIYGVAEGGCT